MPVAPHAAPRSGAAPARRAGTPAAGVIERRRSFRPGVELHRVEGGVELAHPWGRHRLAPLPEGVVAGLAELAAGFCGDDALARAVAAGHAADDPGVFGDLVQLHRILDAVAALVAVAVHRDGEPAVVVVPMSDRVEPLRRGPIEPAVPAEVGLPRHAYLRRLPGAGAPLVLESPLSLFRAEWHDAGALSCVTGLAPGLLGGPEREGVAHAGGDGDAELRLEVLDLLLGAGLLVRSSEPDELEPPPLAMWDFHDLLFHARSRPGRHDYPFGGVFAHATSFPPLPAVKPTPAGEPVELPVPVFAETVAADPPLTAVLESRRSVRTYGAAPLTVGQLAELLYRSVRVRGVHAVDAPGPYDASDRPVPSGGGAGDLEVYATVAHCTGLEPGIYHYDAAAHRLRPLPHDTGDRNRLLVSAWQATGCRVEPQVLLTITSRFGRLSWKYSGIAYAATLKHVGVLYQTFYLVATAMGLAPCALGSGNAEDSARAFGLDWTQESSVGEFLVGSRSEPLQLVTRFDDVVALSRPRDEGGERLAVGNGTVNGASCWPEGTAGSASHAEDGVGTDAQLGHPCAQTVDHVEDGGDVRGAKATFAALTSPRAAGSAC